MSNIFAALCLVSLFFAAGCTRAQVRNSGAPPEPETAPTPEIAKITNPGRVVHVLVALCDNENQGIVPVPAFLGNGEDAGRNLYWGAAFGVRTFFGRSANWTRLAEIKNPSENVLERLVFRHRTQNVYLVADAYRGSKMKATINDFFAAAAGTNRAGAQIAAAMSFWSLLPSNGALAKSASPPTATSSASSTGVITARSGAPLPSFRALRSLG